MDATNANPMMFDQLYAQPSEPVETAPWRRAAYMLSMLEPDDRQAITGALTPETNLRLDILMAELEPMMSALAKRDLLQALLPASSVKTDEPVSGISNMKSLQKWPRRYLLETLRREGPVWGSLLGFALPASAQSWIWAQLSPVERRLWSEQVGAWKVHPARQMLLEQALAELPLHGTSNQGPERSGASWWMGSVAGWCASVLDARGVRETATPWTMEQRA